MSQRSFSDCFWVLDAADPSEFVSSAGYDALLKRIKDGKMLMDEFSNFCKQRAIIEESYGRALIKLAKCTAACQEIGTLRASWDMLRSETEQIGTAHVALSRQLQDDVEKPARDFRERQQVQRRKTDDTVKRAIKFKMSAFDNNKKCRKLYETKCREYDKLEDELKRAVEGAVPKDKLEKVEAKVSKAKQAAEAADQGYKEAVESLEHARQLWESEMERCGTHFQQLDEERIIYTRSALWLSCNLWSATLVLGDQSCEHVRVSLEQCDVAADIDEFIGARQTGTVRPAAIPYVSCYTTTGTATTWYTGADAPAASSPATEEDVLPPLPPLPPLPAKRQHSAPVSMSSPLPSPPTQPSSAATTLAPVPPRGAPPLGQALQAPLVVTVASVPYMAGGGDEFVRVKFAYAAQGDKEISLAVGQLVRILAKSDKTWWRGELHGKSGMFPAAFVGPNTAS